MDVFQAHCDACGHPFELPQSKQGAHVNCPACGKLQQVGRAADVALFWGGTLGCYGLLALICLTGVVVGVLQGMPGLWVSAAVIWGVLTIIGLIVIAAS